MSGLSRQNFADIARSSTALKVAESLFVTERSVKRYRSGARPSCDVIAIAAKQLDAIDYAQNHLETVCPVYQMLMGMKKAALLH